MNTMLTVGISDMKIAQGENTIVTYALGSCIGICLYEPIYKIGALGHIMLPLSPNPQAEKSINKYSDTCIKNMLEQLQQKGCMKSRLIAKIAGGAKMFTVTGDSTFGNIGDRNAEAVRKVLSAYGIQIRAHDIGENYGRTVYFNTNNGEVQVKSFNKPIKIL